ncbi:Arylsulfatase [Posidoniimonas corsicana]|uniref:Arylsulfatase n=1 Tax=Posidoniimonas corsicana TaxID=1938618 RepID=A0A5C5VBH9_9BACT|nr:sulfatase [Posidoniimonas corsicana]TWT35370.1 Arylsulfatase [Posidoniimonas corsicana]
MIPSEQLFTRTSYSKVGITLLRGLLVLLILLAAAPGRAAGLATSKAAGKRLNVLFIVADDLRPELGCYGNQAVRSPSIDRLALRSLVFDRAYCQQAVCSPSRTSVMTGTRPDTNRVWDLNTHFRGALPGVVTLPQLFGAHGYATRGLGKIYHGDLQDAPSWTAPAVSAERRPLRKGRRAAGKRPDHRDEHALLTATPEAWAERVTNTDRGPAVRATDDPPNGGGEGRLADEAIESLRELSGQDKPFFLAVGFRKPHLPFSVPASYWQLYDQHAIPLAPNRFLPDGAPRFSLADKNELWKYSGVPDVSDLPEYYARQLKHGYYAAISYMDAQLGRVLTELDALGLRETTIVVLWGDHGWKLGEHSRWCKHSNFEDDARAPLLIATPGLTSGGGHTDALVEFVDIYPTLAELAGIPKPDHLEGISLKPLLECPTMAWKAAAFSQYPRTVSRQRLMGYSMRTDRYRFTRWVARDDPSAVIAVELYDHRTDPQENVNIADDPAHAPLAAQLAEQWLAGWRGALPRRAQGTKGDQ